MEQTTLPYVVGSASSKDTAKKQATKAVSDNKQILELFKAAGAMGLTDQEIESALKLRQSTASARRRGLVLAGYVTHSGNYRITPSGNKATVWTLSNEAPAAPVRTKQRRSRLNKGTAEIQDEDLRTLLFCSIRYSLGRQSYMPDLVRDIVRTHKRVLSSSDLRQLADEITTECARDNKKLEPDPDTKKWITFKDWLLEEAECR